MAALINGGEDVDMYEVVMRLIGPVMPIGDTRADDTRMENLVALCALVEELHSEICRVAGTSGEHMASIGLAKKFANRFLTDLRGE